MKYFLPLLAIIISLSFQSCQSTSKATYEVIVLGEGTGAIAAAIQSARSGANTLLVNPLPWLGGMLTSAGVSATDGNHKLPAGLWGEFREKLRTHYGGENKLFTGWVSNTMFEPHVGAMIWAEMARNEPNLTVLENSEWKNIVKNDFWEVEIINAETVINATAKILIDGTDLGDVAAAVGASYDLGMDARSLTNETIAPESKNNIVQDLTYVAILQDYGKGTNHTIQKPENYNLADFHCACRKNCDDDKTHDCKKMLMYGKLPNEKYMINWPIKGNDYYANVSEMSKSERQIVYEKAKQHTLGFVYYIQTELGYENLGLADDEFPTVDKLALMPYHREGRRIKGLTQLTINHIIEPYQDTLYKYGIAVGDYPIDHHHYKNEAAPDIDFPKVPSYNIPIGCLIPKDVDNLLIADKAISVTNIANGTTRLQPVIIQIGQAAGLIAAMAVQANISPKDLDIKQVQNELLKIKGYLMPFIDVSPEHPHFEAIQRIGTTGILRGKGIPFQWANQTWFYPDTTISIFEIEHRLNTFFKQKNTTIKEDNQQETLSIKQTITLLNTYINKKNINLQTYWQNLDLKDFDEKRAITKAELAVVLDDWLEEVF